MGQTAAPLDYTSTNALSLPNGATIVYADSSGAAPLALPTPGTNSDGLFAQDITIEPKTVPVVYWPTPASIVYGTALGASQLNAAVTFNNVPIAGAKSYTVDPGTGPEPASGVVLHPGTYPLSMLFTPTDTVDYMPASAAQSITVLKASPTFLVTSPSSIVYGSPWLKLSGQLRAPYPLVMAGGDTVSISIGLGTFTATTTAGGNFTYTLDTSHMPASATPYTIAYAYAGNSDFQPASDRSTSLLVTQRSVTVAANPATKGFGFPDPTFTYQVTSGTIVNGNQFTGSLTRVRGETAGQYPILKGTLTLGSNYNITYQGASLTILPRVAKLTTLSSNYNITYQGASTSPLLLRAARLTATKATPRPSSFLNRSTPATPRTSPLAVLNLRKPKPAAR